MANSRSAREETGTRRLDSWKDIAQYLGRDVTTAMRWEKRRGLPVHRVPGGERGTVYAYPQEIDHWLLGTVKGEGKAGVRSQESRHIESPILIATEVRSSGQETGEAHLMAPGKDILAAAPIPRGRPRVQGYLVTLGCVAIASAVVYILARPAAMPKVLSYQQITNDGWLKEISFMTDGAKIYFSELTPSGWIIADVGTAGGAVKSLSNFFDHPLIQDLSRSRSEFLILDPVGVVPRPGLWAMPLPGGAPRRVGTITANAAAWAPDGNSIVFAAGGELFRCNPDGSGSRKFASLRGRITNIHWSPDGKMLRVGLGHPDQESQKIWEVRADGANAHPLLPDWHAADSQTEGQWTRDGKYFAFGSPDGSSGDLWALSENAGFFGRSSSQPVKLTSGPLSVESWAPSPDGKRAFLLEQGYRGRFCVTMEAQSGS